MQSTIEDVYTQANKEKDVLTTVIAQHMTVIDLFRSAEDRGCLDMDQVQLIRSELGKINASLHTLAEGCNDARTAYQTN